MPSGYKVNNQLDLDEIFQPRGVTVAGPATGFRVGSQDLADRYEYSIVPEDHIEFMTKFLVGADDFSHLFRGLNTQGTGPTFTLQPVSETVISGQPVTFVVTVVGTGTITYQWMRDTGDGSGYHNITGAGSASYSINPTAAGDDANYRVTATDDDGSTNSSIAVLTVNYAPVIISQPVGGTLVAGNVAGFSVGVTQGNPAPADYYWRKNGDTLTPGGKYAGVNTPNLTFVTDESDDNSDYSVLVVNSVNAIVSAPAHLVVLYGPKILNNTSTNPTLNTGATLAASVLGIGNPAVTYQWLKNGASLGSANGAQTANYAKANAQTGDSGGYSCAISNGLGTVFSSTITVTVSEVQQAPNFSVHPQDQSVREGTNATFNVTVSGLPTPTLSWRKNGVTIPGQTGNTLTLFGVSNSDEGGYVCVAINSAGTQLSGVGTLNVVVDPTIIGITATDTTPAYGDFVGITVTATGDNLSYQWFKNSGLISGATGSSHVFQMVSIVSAGAFYCVVSGPFASATSGAISIDNPAGTPPTITSQPDPIDDDAGVTVALQCSATIPSAEAPVYFRWFKNGLGMTPRRVGNISPTQDQHVFSPLDPADAGTWVCVCSTDFGGSTDSDFVTVTVT